MFEVVLVDGIVNDSLHVAFVVAHLHFQFKIYSITSFPLMVYVNTVQAGSESRHSRSYRKFIFTSRCKDNINKG